MNSQREPTARIAESPVFITGAPKTGKSVLLGIFRQVEEFYVVDEPLSTWLIGSSSGEDDCRDEADAPPKERSRIRAEIEEILKSSGKQRYVDLMSHHALQLPYLQVIYPNARVIIVTRDPRDFVPEAVYFWTLKPSIKRTLRNRWRQITLESIPNQAIRFIKNLIHSRREGRLNTWGAIVPNQKEFADTHSVVEVAAYQWAMIYERALKTARNWPGSVLFVKFEDLKQRPRETVQHMLSFCQIETTEKLMDFVDGYFDPQFVTHQRVELLPADWRSVWPVLRDTASKLGYEVPRNEETLA